MNNKGCSGFFGLKTKPLYLDRRTSSGYAFASALFFGDFMEIFTAFISAISDANPMVLVTVISVVALLVVAECVRQLCKAMRKD